MTDKELLGLALEALKKMVRLAEYEGWEGFDEQYKAIKVLEEALAKQEQSTKCVGEPVAWMDRDGDIYKELPNEYWNPPHTPIYAQREWVGLTEDEVIELLPVGFWDIELTFEFSQAIEAKLKEKNT
jgi:hypothetical protein